VGAIRADLPYAWRRNSGGIVVRTKKAGGSGTQHSHMLILWKKGLLVNIAAEGCAQYQIFISVFFGFLT
jgi:hypothetical protein